MPSSNASFGCFIKSMQLARAHYPSERKIALVFDNRPHREAANKRVFEIYQRNFKVQQKPPEPTGVAFLSSIDAKPLQAADMVAWESYRHAINWLKNGPKAK